MKPIHSEGKPRRSACSLTYHDSRMVSRIGVDAPAFSGDKAKDGIFKRNSPEREVEF